MTVNTNLGKITATPRALNYILMIAEDAADRYEDQGLIHLKAETMVFSLGIKETLIKSGLYDNF